MVIKLKEIRLKKGLTIRNLAELSGVSKSEISYIEKEARDPTMTTLCKLANALEVKLDDLCSCTQNTEKSRDEEVKEMNNKENKEVNYYPNGEVNIFFFLEDNPAENLSITICLKKLRLRKKLSTRKLAELSNVTKSFISDIERGHKMPTIPIMCRLARALGVEIQELFWFR